jgi:hypothetical protein
MSVLASASTNHVIAEPFAHVVLEDAIDRNLYSRLEKDFPAPERFTKGMADLKNNQAIRIPARAIVDSMEFSADWREFFRYHTSQDFWMDIVRTMGDALRAAHPGLEATAGKPLENWRVGKRGTDESGDVALDALFVVNTPVTKVSSVRPAHVDSEDEIWAGLLYMKSADDRTSGGDLAMYHFKNRPAFGGHYAPLSAVVQDKVVSYGSNRFVSFINSERSIHGVTPRAATDRYRRYINMVAVTPFKAFSLPRMSPLGQLKFWLDRRGTKASGTMAKGY